MILQNSITAKLALNYISISASYHFESALIRDRLWSSNTKE